MKVVISQLVSIPGHQHPPFRVGTGLKPKEAMRCPNGQTTNAAAVRRKPTTGNGRRSESEEGHNE
jgi:hypothetical protein